MRASSQYLLLLVLAMCEWEHMEATEQSDLIKPSYGVIFHHTGIVHTATDSYHFTFVLKWPEVPDIPSYDIDCSNLHDNDTTMFIDQCRELLKMVSNMYQDTRRVILHFNRTLTNIQHVLPKHWPSRTRRKFPMVFGPLTSTILDFVDEQRIYKLKQHVAFLEHNQEILVKKFHSFGEDMSALMNLTDDRFSNLIHKLLDNNQAVIHKLNAVVGKMNEDILRFLTNMQLYRSHQFQMNTVLMAAFDHLQFNGELLTSVDNILYSWLTAASELVNQRLPISLISPDMLSNVLSNVKTHLREVEPNLELTFSQLSYYYQSAKTYSTYTDKHLYIMLPIPLKHIDESTIFNLYHIYVHPVSTPGSSSVTQITNVPNFYAISLNKKYAFNMDTATYSTCTTDGKIRSCHSPLAIRLLDPTLECIDALYQDRNTLVTTHCQFKVTSYLNQPVLIKYGKYAIVSSLDGELLLVCPNNFVRKLDKCPSICIIQIGCACQLQSRGHIFPQNNLLCSQNLSKTEIYYGENLPFLTHYLGKHNIPKGWNGSTLFTKTLFKNLPKVPNSFLQAFNDTMLSSDDKYHQHLASLVAKVKEDTSTKGITLPSNILPSRPFADILNLLSLLLAIVAIAISLLVFWRVQKLVLLVALLTHNTGVESLPLRPISQLPWQPSVSTTTPQTASSSTSPESIYHSTTIVFWLIFILAFLLMITAAKWLWHIATRGTTVHLLLYSATSYIKIKLFTFPNVVRNVTYSGHDIIQHIRLTRFSCFQSYVIIDWRDVSISIDGINILLPDKFHINPIMFRKIATISQQNYATLLIIQQGSILLGYVGFVPPDIPTPDVITASSVRYRGSNFRDTLKHPLTRQLTRRHSMIHFARSKY